MPDDIGSELYKPIRGALETAIMGEQGQLPKIVIGIKDFLKDEKKYQIDDCIRWLILIRAVNDGAEETGDKVVVKEVANESIDSEKNAVTLITKIIIDISPRLAFENPYRPSDTTLIWKTDDIKKRCKYIGIHGQFKAKGLKTTPFHMAAEVGNGKAVKHMIYGGEHLAADNAGKPLQRDLLLQVLRLPDPGNADQKSALLLAATSDDEDLGALEALLNFDTRIADPPDRTFKYALNQGKANVVKAFLQFEKLRNVFITSEHIIKAMDLSNRELNSTVRKQRVDVVNTLIGYATTGDVINDQVVEKIIQLNLKDVWAKKSPEIKLDTSRLLNLAVQHQNADFVKMFLRDLRKNSDSNTLQKDQSNYPLWHNNKILIGSEWKDRKSIDYPEKDKIHDMIVTATIKNKKIDKMQELLQIIEGSGCMCIPSTFIAPYNDYPLLELIS